MNHLVVDVRLFDQGLDHHFPPFPFEIYTHQTTIFHPSQINAFYARKSFFQCAHKNILVFDSFQFLITQCRKISLGFKCVVMWKKNSDDIPQLGKER